MSGPRVDRMPRRRSPPRQNRRSDERNNSSSSSSRRDFDMNMSMGGGGGGMAMFGGGPPPLPSLMAGGGRAAFPPNSKLSGTAFSEAELLNDVTKKKFTGRCRLFVGNLPTDLKEQELKELFTPHGDISECYLSGKGFAFLRLDTRAHAESAKEALDGKTIKGRQIRVRFAVHGATIKIKEVSPAVSNEMLHLTFSAFGEVERAVHIVDEKGRPTGEGIVEFEKKNAAQEALAQIKERVFLLTANSRPLRADLLEPRDEEDGLSEKMLTKTHQLMKERELGPRFAAMNSFEYVYGRRWKDLYDYEGKRRQELEVELREQRRRLDADMEVAYEDYKAELLREELERRKEELERLEAARRMRDQHRQQMMDQMGGERWIPPIIDGPMGRPPPTFGSAGRGGPLGMGMGLPPPFGQGGGQGIGIGGSPMDGRGQQQQHQNGHGMGGQQPQLGPDVRKLLQTFKEQPLNMQSGGAGGQGAGGGQPGGIPPPPNRMPSPLSAFANLINPLPQPLMQRPGSGGGGGGMPQQQQHGGMGGPGSGGNRRIPPPPPPMGAMQQPSHQQMMDFTPPEKRSRH